MNQEEIIKRLKIIKAIRNITNKEIADCLGMKNARSVANFLHGDYNLSEEKRGKRTSWFCDIRTKHWREFTQSFNRHLTSIQTDFKKTMTKTDEFLLGKK